MRQISIRILIVCLLIARGASAGGCSDPPDLREVDVHYMFHFVPQHRQAECILRINLSATGSSGAVAGGGRSIFSIASDYMLRNEPKVGPFSHELRYLSDAYAVFYVLLPDECARRDTIGSELAAALTRSLPGIRASLHMPHPRPGPKTIEGWRYWLDATDYDPDYWSDLRLAHRGDANALLAMARRSDVEGADHAHPGLAYIYYYLAEQRLNDEGLLRLTARRMNAILAREHGTRRTALQRESREWDRAIRYHAEQCDFERGEDLR